MPTTINEQNARQIRQPMDVLITMQVPDDDITLSFSGYTSTSKVSDGRLTQPTWPMRRLADLKGDGFALSGSYALYESLTPSATNGKLGVRGHVGQVVSLTVTGSQQMAGLTLLVTGASAVTYNGYSHEVTSGRVSFLVGATTAVLTLTPASEETRIEISEVQTGADITITNDNLISCIVSLRSDLSPFDQTLPESELNIDAYFDEDVSEAVAMIPDDTPIYYRAGYDSDMSPLRSFYVAGQITWADNVLSIHAVDAVHFLDDIEIGAPITEEDSDYIMNATFYLLDLAGIECEDYTQIGWWSGAQRWIIKEGTKARDFIAFLNQCFNLTDGDNNLYDGTGQLQQELQYAYVDAGVPTLTTRSLDRGYHSVYEHDCADVKRSIERLPGSVSAEYLRITNLGMPYGGAYAQKIGTATFIKNVGTSLSFDKYAYEWTIGLYLGPNRDNDIAKKLANKFGTFFSFYNTCMVVPANDSGYWYTDTHSTQVMTDHGSVGKKLAKGEIPQSKFGGYPPNSGNSGNFSAFVPWSQAYHANWRYDNDPAHQIRTAAQMWNVLTAAGVIASDALTIDLDIYGCAFNLEADTYTNISDEKGGVYTYGELPVIGRVAARTAANTDTLIYPNRMLSVGMYRSPVTGSFTWKGDPRMQPRDIIHFHRLDGTVEDVTIESITLKHEGGGTTAEITYRKGVI